MAQPEVARLRIRLAGQADEAVLAELFYAIDRHYWAAAAPSLGGQLFMKDLFVAPEARGRGAGQALMEFLARLALARGCVRFDWTAETSNPAALAFYDRLGARRIEEKVYFRFDGEALRALAART